MRYYCVIYIGNGRPNIFARPRVILPQLYTIEIENYGKKGRQGKHAQTHPPVEITTKRGESPAR